MPDPHSGMAGADKRTGEALPRKGRGYSRIG